MQGCKKVWQKKSTEICTFCAIIILVFLYYSYYLANNHDKKPLLNPLKLIVVAYVRLCVCVKMWSVVKILNQFLISRGPKSCNHSTVAAAAQVSPCLCEQLNRGQLKKNFTQVMHDYLTSSLQDFHWSHLPRAGRLIISCKPKVWYRYWMQYCKDVGLAYSPPPTNGEPCVSWKILQNCCWLQEKNKREWGWQSKV